MNSDIERIQNNVHCYESVSLANDDVCTALGIIIEQAEQIKDLTFKLNAHHVANKQYVAELLTIERLKNLINSLIFDKTCKISKIETLKGPDHDIGP